MDDFICNEKKVAENDTYVLLELNGLDAEELADDFGALETIFPEYQFNHSKFYRCEDKGLYLDEDCDEFDSFDIDENGQLIKF